MLIKFEVSGESPEIGRFSTGEERGIPDAIASILVLRGIAVEIKPERTQKAPAVKEVRSDGK